MPKSWPEQNSIISRVMEAIKERSPETVLPSLLMRAPDPGSAHGRRSTPYWLRRPDPAPAAPTSYISQQWIYPQETVCHGTLLAPPDKCHSLAQHQICQIALNCKKQYLFDFYPVFHKKFINCELSNRRRSTVLQYQWFGKNLEELEKLRMKIVLHLTNFAQSWHSTCLNIFIGFFALLLFSKTQHWRPHPTPPLLCISDIHMTAAPPPLTNEIPFQKLPPNKSPSFPKPASYLSNSPGTIFQHVSYF